MCVCQKASEDEVRAAVGRDFYVLLGLSSINLSRTSELRNKALSTQRLSKWRLNYPYYFRILGESELKNVKEFQKKSIDTCSDV